MLYFYWLISLGGAIFAVLWSKLKCTQGTLRRFKSRLGLNYFLLPDIKPYQGLLQGFLAPGGGSPAWF